MSTPCSFVTCLLLYVLLCVFMSHRVPLSIPVSPETRQGLRRLGIQRHLNVGSRLRVLTDEALEEQQTTDGQRPRRARLEDANELTVRIKAAPPEPSVDGPRLG